MRTIPDVLNAMADADDRYVHTYNRRGQIAERVSHAELARRARGCATEFLERGARAEDFVFLQLPNSLTLIQSFLGCVIAGLRPCCLAGPRALGGLETFRKRLERLQSHFPQSHFVAPADVGDSSGLRYWPPPESVDDVPLQPITEVHPEALAFVQLTSGSTQHPKAVRISHRALLANVDNLSRSGERRARDRFVSWLPCYHDMGLVGGLFCSLALTADLHLLQPESFLARPRTWLQVIHDVGPWTVSTAPNFAYQSCVQRTRPEEVAGLDLSNWRIAGCGSERVRSETLEAFIAHFAPAGFRAEAFVPCYGMAEATLAVTFGNGTRPPRTHDGHVSCGRAIPDAEIVIRDVHGEPLPEGEQGEITVRSPSLCDGYAGNEYPSPVRAGWLWTGDRGYLFDDELYVTGRLKDLIIVDGVNFDPEEFESIAEEMIQTPGGRSAAFPFEVDGRERVVLVNEIDSRAPEDLALLHREVGDRIARTFGFALHDFLFVRRGTLTKTSSGKVKRATLRRKYENQSVQVLWQQRSNP